MFLIIMTLYVSYIIFLICCRHFKIVQSNNAYNHLFCHLSLDHFLIHIKLFSSYFYIKKKVFLFLISNMQVTSVLKWSQRFVFTSGRCCRNCWKLFLLTKSCCRTDWSICFKYIKGKKKRIRPKGNWSQRLHVYKGLLVLLSLQTCRIFQSTFRRSFFSNTGFVHLSCF